MLPNEIMFHIFDYICRPPFYFYRKCSGVGCGKIAKETEKLLRCSFCKHVYYCNQSCQKSDYKKHAQCCKTYVESQKPKHKKTVIQSFNSHFGCNVVVDEDKKYENLAILLCGPQKIAKDMIQSILNNKKKNV